MWTFVETLQRRSAEASDMVVQIDSANRAQLASWFEHQLAALPAETRERTLNALAMTLAPESWVVLRERLGLSVEQARDELDVRCPRRAQRRLASRLASRASASSWRSRRPISVNGPRCSGRSRDCCPWRRVPLRTSATALASGSLPANWRCARSAR